LVHVQGIKKLMGKKNDHHLLPCEKLLEAAGSFQQLIPEAVLIAGSAVAAHIQHRFSFDAN